MKYVHPALRLSGYFTVVSASIVAVAALIVVNWWAARPQQAPHRLRWVAVAKSEITQGRQLTEAQLQWRLVKLAQDSGYIASAKAAVGKYAQRTIGAGKLLSPADLAELPPADVLQGGAVVPVEVRSDYAASLKPGMRLAFVHEKAILPSLETLTTGKDGRGFLLSAMGVSSSDTKVTLLTVQVEAADLPLVPMLGTGEWRPVILSNPQ